MKKEHSKLQALLQAVGLPEFESFDSLILAM